MKVQTSGSKSQALALGNDSLFEDVSSGVAMTTGRDVRLLCNTLYPP